MPVAFSVYSRGQHDYCRERDFIVRKSYDGDSVIITSYRGRNTDVRVPYEIGGLPVSGIDDSAFIGGHWRRGRGFITGHQITSVAIPDSVTFIGNSAFMYNKLTYIVIPDSVTSIGRLAFMYNNLSSVTIPNSVTSIGEHAFRNNQLTHISILSEIIQIGLGAFADNHQLISITVGNDVEFEQWNVDTFGLFGPAFGLFYESQGRRAGTYTYNNGTWSVVFR